MQSQEPVAEGNENQGMSGGAEGSEEGPARPPLLPESELKLFTLEELSTCVGDNGGPIYLAIKGQVFDVSSKPHLYGKGR